MVRAKFSCNNKSEPDSDGLVNISLSPVYSGSEENKAFFAWTPSGSITLGCVNPAANEKFAVGREYYVDFTACE
jgi:hypothetical protein